MLFRCKLAGFGPTQDKYIDAPAERLVRNFLKSIDPSTDWFELETCTDVSVHPEDYFDIILDEDGRAVYDESSLTCKCSYNSWPTQVAEQQLYVHGLRKRYFGTWQGDDYGPVVCEYSKDSQLWEHELPLEPSLKLANHSPTGFAWSYSGSGPSQLALAILLNEFGDPVWALQNYQEFKNEFIGPLPKADWVIEGEQIRVWRQTRG